MALPLFLLGGNMKYLEGSNEKLLIKENSKAWEIHNKIKKLNEEMVSYIRKPEANARISSPADVYIMLKPMINLLQEEFWVISLNTRNKILSMDKLYTGTINTSSIRVSEILRLPIIHSALSIIVCHNHPSEDASPSPEDIKLTKDLKEACKILDIELLDHVIIGNTYYSMKESCVGGF